MADKYLITDEGLAYCAQILLDFYHRDPEGAKKLAEVVGLDLEAWLDQHDPERRMKTCRYEGPYR